MMRMKHTKRMFFWLAKKQPGKSGRGGGANTRELRASLRNHKSGIQKHMSKRGKRIEIVRVRRQITIVRIVRMTVKLMSGISDQGEGRCLLSATPIPAPSIPER